MNKATGSVCLRVHMHACVLSKSKHSACIYECVCVRVSARAFHKVTLIVPVFAQYTQAGCGFWLAAHHGS